jgi:hypothetical protein
MFLVVVTMMFIMTTNSVKYGLHTNIIPLEGYKGRKNLEVCPFRDLPLGNRDPYVGILVHTRDPPPEGPLGKLVLHSNR